ncbi:MAG: hypothetical protein ACLRSW_05090 [Christensenellaceae bacterium]
MTFITCLISLLRGYAGGERVYLWDEQRDGNQSAIDETLEAKACLEWCKANPLKTEEQGERMIGDLLDLPCSRARRMIMKINENPDRAGNTALSG